MQQSTAPAPSPTSASFAGLLAALAAPAPSWNEDGLEDDVATLSYERALMAHARYRPTDQSLMQPAVPLSIYEDEAPAPAAAQTPQAAARPAANLEPDLDRHASAPQERNQDRNLKNASITIRLSQAECAQLHRRAAEAGLTVSAYLRSCTFEAEALRAMVKDTLAQLRPAKAPAEPAQSTLPRPSRFGRLPHQLASLLTPWHGSPRVARA
jgi:predicted DNA binding CopG/RHH family protein